MQRLTLLFVFLLGLVSCEKEKQAPFYPGRQGPLVASVVTSQGSADSYYDVTTYAYDADGRITSLTTKEVSEGETTYTTTSWLNYDEDRVDIETRYEFPASPIENFTQRMTVWLNEAGRMTAGEYQRTQQSYLRPTTEVITGYTSGTISAVYGPNGHLESYSDESQQHFDKIETKNKSTDLTRYLWTGGVPSSYNYHTRGIRESGEVYSDWACHITPRWSSHKNTTNTDFLTTSDNLFRELGFLGDLCPYIPEKMDYTVEPPLDPDVGNIDISFTCECSEDGLIRRVTQKLSPDDDYPTIWEFTYL